MSLDRKILWEALCTLAPKEELNIVPITEKYMCTVVSKAAYNFAKQKDKNKSVETRQFQDALYEHGISQSGTLNYFGAQGWAERNLDRDQDQNVRFMFLLFLYHSGAF